jgi:transcriptional regulator with XRE-family HTH domain
MEQERDYEVMDAEVVDSSIVPVASEALVELAAQAERRVEAINKIKQYSLRLTQPGDWVDQNGRPYLQVSGAEKIARLFGISWRIDEPIREELEGGHYIYTYKGYFSLAGAEIEVIGSRSSKDPFFKRYVYVNGQRKELPPSEIDPGGVKKAAYTNCIGNGITRLLGLRNISYEDLEKVAGIKREQITRIEYRGKGKQNNDTTPAEIQEITGEVSDVRMKKGKTKTGKDYTLYTIQIGDELYKTFSETQAKLAKEAKETGTPVAVKFTFDSFGNNVESIELAIREPGEEG